MNICAEGASCSATQGFKWLVSVCVFVTDFSDFCGYRLHRGHPLFPLVAFQLGFSGIPENHEKTSKSYLRERYTRTPFWDPFFALFSEKVPFFPRRPGDGPASRFSSYQGRIHPANHIKTQPYSVWLLRDKRRGRAPLRPGRRSHSWLELVPG